MNNDFQTQLNAALDRLEKACLKRTMPEISGSQGKMVVVAGKRVLNFSSNNYLGLADDVRILDAAKNSLDRGGFGSGASRLVCGNFSAHRQLEERMAEFKNTQKCLLFSCGYMANVGIISGLFGRGDLILSDRNNHASIVDGIVLSRATHKRYKHCDMDHLEELLKQSESRQYRTKVIITDTVFSMDGECAPLQKIAALAKKYSAVVMVDEAHAFGILGDQGSGLVEHLGLEQYIDIQMGTFSKASGGYGAYCCGSQALIDVLINSARSLIYTTALPPSVCDANLKSLSIIENEPRRRFDLLDQSRYVRAQLHLAGFDVIKGIMPIIPVLLNDEKTALEFSRMLLEKEVFVQAIRPPTVAKGTSRLRITICSSHSDDDIENLLDAMYSVGSKLGII